MKTEILCKHCGAIVPQKAGRGRPRQYCPEGTCQGAAKRERDLRRASPGLEGALARAEDLYDRMEAGLAQAIEPLARVLADELSPAGVEAKVSSINAEAAARVASANTDREDALRRLRDAQVAATRAEAAHGEEVATLRAELAAAREAAGAAAAQAERLASERDAAESRADEADARAADAKAKAGEAGERAAADRAAAQAADAARNEARKRADEAEAARESSAREAVVARTEKDMAVRSREVAERERTSAVARAAAATESADRAGAELAALKESSSRELTVLREEKASLERESGEALRALRAEAAEASARADGLAGRLEDHRVQLSSARAEVSVLLERAVTAEVARRATEASLAALEKARDAGN